MRPPRLLAITPGDGRALAPWLVAMGRAGLPGVLLREPEAADLPALVAVARDHIPLVIVHARCPGWDVVVGPELGLHLPDGVAAPECEAGLVGASRHRWGPGALDGLDYALLSPVWAPTSKPADSRPTLGLSGFLEAVGGAPVLALGGLTPARFWRLREAGGYGAAVLGDLFGRRDPAAAAARVGRYLGG